LPLSNGRVTLEGTDNLTETFRLLYVAYWAGEKNKRRKKLEDNDKFDNRNEENEFNGT
jgi:hypothetical protein